MHYVTASTGVGKSYIACVLAQEACCDGYSASYTRAAALFHDLALTGADGSFRNLLARLSRIDVLVIDDWAMAPLSEPAQRDVWEICEVSCHATTAEASLNFHLAHTGTIVLSALLFK